MIHRQQRYWKKDHKWFYSWDKYHWRFSKHLSLLFILSQTCSYQQLFDPANNPSFTNISKQGRPSNSVRASQSHNIFKDEAVKTSIYLQSSKMNYTSSTMLLEVNYNRKFAQIPLGLDPDISLVESKRKFWCLLGHPGCEPPGCTAQNDLWPCSAG